MSVALVPADPPAPPLRRLRVVGPPPTSHGDPGVLSLPGVPPLHHVERHVVSATWVCTAPPARAKVGEDWLRGRTLPVQAGFAVAGYASGW